MNDLPRERQFAGFNGENIYMAVSNSFTSLAERMLLHALASPDKPAVICDGRSLTYGMLMDQASALAIKMIASGLVPGGVRRAGIISFNSLDVAIIHGACQLSGIAAVPLPVLVTEDAQARMIQNAEIALLFCQSDRVEGVKSALDTIDIGSGVKIVALGASDAHADQPFLQDWLKDKPDTIRIPQVQPNWISDLIYSSGTTGLPKGIAQTFEGRALQWINLGGFGLNADARVLQTVGLASSLGLSGLFSAWWWGGCCYIMSKFSADQSVRILSEEGANVAFLAPATLIRIIETPDFVQKVRGKPCVKICSGAPISASQKRLVVETWPGPFYEIYGQTETAPVSVLPVHATPADKLGTVGRPLPGIIVRILDEDGEILDVDEEGEIAVHSPTVMAGYQGFAENEASTYWLDGEGRRFVRTGDVGRFDGEGYLWLCDRKKDMIISGGYNVFPADIEKILSGHPAIFEAAVIGCPSKKWGETPVAIVTLQSGATIGADELRDWANDQLGAVQRVAAVRIVSELPSGALGKILKRQLRAEVINLTGILP